MQDRLNNIEESLVVINEKLTSLRVDIAEQAQFWSQAWPNALAKIEDNATKITKLEIELVALKTRMMIWGAILMAGAPIVASLVIRYILPYE